jgi:D-ala D-ala ligase C-terminus.
VDYLLSKEGKLYVNEINTVPGSLAYYLFEPQGITYAKLLGAIIKGAEMRTKENKKTGFPTTAMC